MATQELSVQDGAFEVLRSGSMCEWQSTQSGTDGRSYGCFGHKDLRYLIVPPWVVPRQAPSQSVSNQLDLYMRLRGKLHLMPYLFHGNLFFFNAEW